MEYEIHKTGISDDKIRLYSQLLSSVFTVTDKFTPKFLNWQYAQNPLGNVIGFDAFYDGKLAAHYVTIPVAYKIHDKETKGLLSLNTVTHPAHRGKGLYTKLASQTYEEGRKAGYEFIIGVGNANSTHGLVNKLGFIFISALDVKIGIGEIVPPDNANYLMQSSWDEKTLLWRLSNPSTSYFLNNNNYIIARTGKCGIDALIMHQRKSLVPLKLKNKKSLIKIWIGIAGKKHQRGFFIDLPQKLKPSPLNLAYKDLVGNMPVLKKKDIFFELIDFDAY